MVLKKKTFIQNEIIPIPRESHVGELQIYIKFITMSILKSVDMGHLLLTWFNFNPSMDK